ncbi:MAG: asparagine synthetase B [Microvirga sp.]|nr:asparagine synthetase B [Microvirga sp.]
MCGIAGALVSGDGAAARARVERMLTALAHRGPDGGGLAAAGDAVIGMRRLRIRSAPDAELPFVLNDDLRAAYNGEVYAAGEGGFAPGGGACEASALAGEEWRAADGMHALALLDGRGGLRLSRDRFGIKPLFVRSEDDGFAFASELPALLAEGDGVEVDLEALHEILAFGRTLDRRTLYCGVRELDPGEELRVGPRGAVLERTPAPRRVCAFHAFDDGALRAAIHESVALTLVSDRPLGLALSGGLDSSILAHELRELGVSDLRTLSLSIPDNDDGVRSLAELGLGGDPVSGGWRHKAMPIDEAGYMTGLVEAARRNGEPFRMSSLPLYYALGEAARAQGATVLLLGEGADEIFGGYESYRAFDPTSENLRRAIGAFYLGGGGGRYLNALLGPTAFEALGRRLDRRIQSLVDGLAPKQALLAVERVLSLEPLLRRADHTLMAAGVEGRTPFLHGRAPDIASALPDSELWNAKDTKRALRRAYRAVLPAASAMAPKRALRAPGRFWKVCGAAALDDVARHGGQLFAALGIREAGVTAVREGCAAGDPAAIPLAVALISTAACMSRLAEEDRLSDPSLGRAARAAARAFDDEGSNTPTVGHGVAFV